MLGLVVLNLLLEAVILGCRKQRPLDSLQLVQNLLWVLVLEHSVSNFATHLLVLFQLLQNTPDAEAQDIKDQN
jgi:hypothetical protein